MPSSMILTISQFFNKSHEGITLQNDKVFYVFQATANYSVATIDFCDPKNNI